MFMTGLANTEAFSLKIHAGRESGPGAFEDLRFSRSLKIEYSLVISKFIVGER